MSERHLEKDLANIRADHLGRYQYTSTFISGDVIDVACGCGYGSVILAKSNNVLSVTGIDIDGTTIEFAKKFWPHEKVNYITADASKHSISCDWLVSFETIEHIENPAPFLKSAAKNCKKLVCSVPNETKLPFNKKKFPYHYRHYTRQQITSLLEECGFVVDEVLFQTTKTSANFVRTEGRTIFIKATSTLNQ